MNTEIAKLFKALSDKTRLEIIESLLKCKEISCQEIQQEFALSQPTLSFHFSKLINAGILIDRKEGASHYYRINKKHLKGLGIDIKRILGI